MITMKKSREVNASMTQCEIARQFFDLMQAINNAQKTPCQYDSGPALFHAELTLLEKIHQHPHANASTLSSLCGVTNSAITQICNKLSEKGLIEKYQRGQNRKERYFSLTPQGEAVRLSHQEVHREAEETMRRYLCGLDAESKRIIMDFMEKMRQTMPIGVFTCPCEQEGQACISQKRNQEACSHA